MSISILGPSSWPSVQRLRQALASSPGDLRVCWGSISPGALNSSPRLNSIEQLEAFRNAGLNTPIYTTDISLAQSWVADGVLVFGRRLFHTQGRDITGPGRGAPPHFRRQWRESEWWVQVVPSVAQEWRIHVAFGKSIARGVKEQKEEPRRKMPVRNRANGWRMRHDIDPPKGLRTAAKKAVAACGYDFGAVDMILTEGGEIYVLEVNRAPGLDDYTCGAYAETFRQRATQSQETQS